MFCRFILPLVPGWSFPKQGLKFFFSVYLFICFNKKEGKGGIGKGFINIWTYVNMLEGIK